MKRQIAARAAQQDDSAPFTLGWCYLSDYYAPAAEAILDDLRLRFPGLAWVGTVGVGVAASGMEYIDEPALVLMIAPLPRESFRLFSGLQPCLRHRPASRLMPRRSMPKAARPTCRS